MIICLTSVAIFKHSYFIPSVVYVYFVEYIIEKRRFYRCCSILLFIVIYLFLVTLIVYYLVQWEHLHVNWHNLNGRQMGDKCRDAWTLF